MEWISSLILTSLSPNKMVNFLMFLVFKELGHILQDVQRLGQSLMMIKILLIMQISKLVSTCLLKKLECQVQDHLAKYNLSFCLKFPDLFIQIPKSIMKYKIKTHVLMNHTKNCEIVIMTLVSHFLQ